MQVVILECGRIPYLADIDGSLESMQKIVGGYIEPVLLGGDGLILVCNEEGKLRGMPKNIDIGGDVVCGDCFICGTDGEDFIGLTDDQVARVIGAIGIMDCDG